MRAAVIVVVVALAGLAVAQQSKPVLHEPFSDPASDRGSPMIGGSGTDRMPAALNAGDKVLPKPDPSRPGRKDEPVLGKGGFAADRDTSMKADENTASDSTLHYVSVFNPDVLPFKRMSAFDKIMPDETLRVASTALVEIPVGGTTDARTRDRFYGDVLVQLSPGRDVPLPSVAPDMRILSYEIKPRMTLHFSKDGADNFFVRSDEASANGQYRLLFTADADANYFAPSLPPRAYIVRDILAHAPPELRQQLASVPPELRRQAQKTLDRIGVDRDQDLSSAFNRLVGYFRAFQAGELRHHSGDVYRDLCDSQTGVCRHRSFAFMISANALGIPTRYVQNEAHAFVEVWFPERNWQRIDLGGAALRLEVTGADEKALHRPRAEDPFTKPQQYTNSYTQLQGDIKGLSDRQIADKHRSLDQSPPSGAVGSTDSSGSGAPEPARISPDPTLPSVTQDPKKQNPVLRITQADTSAYRGATIHVEGIVTAEHKPLADHTVRVFIAPAGEGHLHSVPLGLATTGADGTFRVDLPVPNVQLSTYDLLLSTDEDAYYNAALSE
jgi:transglutaminase-like putative cysteine protease